MRVVHRHKTLGAFRGGEITVSHKSVQPEFHGSIVDRINLSFRQMTIDVESSGEDAVRRNSHAGQSVWAWDISWRFGQRRVFRFEPSGHIRFQEVSRSTPAVSDVPV